MPLARRLLSSHLVTAPRQLLRGTTYLVSRRCTQREFLLKPSTLSKLIFKFVLAVAAARYGILIHAACVMSDHYHLVLTDPHARLPDFNHLLDGVLAKALNALYARWENLWVPSSYSAVALIAPEDVLDKVAYTLANPTAAHLVEHGRHWPGLWSRPTSIGGPGELVERPGHYFAKNGSMPETERLVFSVPPGFESADAFRAALVAELSDRERAAAAQREAKGMGVLGARRVRKQKHTERPRSAAPRRVLNPKVAAKDTRKRIEALERLARFLASYRDAVVRFWEGERNVVFPEGTYLMRVRFGAACAGS